MIRVKWCTQKKFLHIKRIHLARKIYVWLILEFSISEQDQDDRAGLLENKFVQAYKAGPKKKENAVHCNNNKFSSTCNFTSAVTRADTIIGSNLACQCTTYSSLCLEPPFVWAVRLTYLNVYLESVVCSIPLLYHGRLSVDDIYKCHK